MKKISVLIILLVCLIGVIYAAIPDRRDWDTLSGITRQYEYVQINSVTSDDTKLAANTKYWDSIDPDNGVFIPINPAWSIVELSFYCYGDGAGDGDPTAGTFDFQVYAARLYGSAKLVFSGNGQCGEVELSANPINGSQYNSGSLDANNSYKWADVLQASGTGDVWISDVVLSGNTGTEAGGNIGTVSFDMNGHYILWCEITNMTNASVTSVTCVASGYD